MKMLLAVGLIMIVAVIATAVTSLAQGLVDLNTAGSSQLEKLYRVSPKIASKIIMEREKSGPYASLEDVAVRIKEIGPKMIAKWEGMAVVIHPAAN
jgi:competence protein ComEA